MIIFLNGTSSAGKTSIARALQDRTETPLLLVGIDTLFDMLPPRFVGETSASALGYQYTMKNGVLDHIALGPYAKRLVKATVPVVQALLACGNDIVIDEILFAGEGRDFLHAYAEAFVGHCAYFIKVDCPLPVLEDREQKRADRHRGLARLQYEAVHAHGFAYDYTVRTDRTTPEVCAEQIITYMQQQQNPTAFAAIRAAHRRAQ